MYTRIQSFHTYAYKLCVHIYKLCIIRIKKEKKNQKTVKTKVKKKTKTGTHVLYPSASRHLKKVTGRNEIMQQR